MWPMPVDLTTVGISYLSWMNCKLFLVKYTKNSPVEDVVKALCRESFIVSNNLTLDLSWLIEN